MLRTRLFFGLLPLVLLVVGTGSYAIIVCNQLETVLRRDFLSGYDAIRGAQRMRDDAGGMASALDSAQGVNLVAASRSFAEFSGRFSRELSTQSAAVAGTDRMGGLARVDAAYQALLARGEGILPSGIPGSLNDLQQNGAAVQAVLAAVDEFDRRNYEAARVSEDHAARLATETVRVLVSVIVSALLVSLIVAWLLAKSLLGPIQALTSSAVALGDGNLELAVPESSVDEFKKLAQAFNTMADKLRLYRQATAARVLRTQRTMEATLISTPDPLFVIGRDGRHEIRNPAAEILAANPKFKHGLPEPLQQRVSEVLATGQHFLPAGYEDVVTLRVGPQDRHYLPRILAIGDNLSGFDGAAVFLQDVTKFRLLDDAKNNLVGTVSHELKTPLTSLRMAVYLLLERNLGSLTPAQIDLLETARDDADRLLGILNDLLDLTRLESGVAQLHRTEVRVSGLMDDMVREIWPMTEVRGQRVDVRVNPALTTVAVDRERIRHVFINLLANAAKYSPEQSAIELYAEPADDGYIRFGVRDNGPGIPPENIGRIFEKFYRLPGQAGSGAGLGLAIAREIVLAHGGTISCSSVPGNGSDFHFLLPSGAPVRAAPG